MASLSREHVSSGEVSKPAADVVRRVAAYPIDFTTAKGDLMAEQQQLQKLKNCAGIDLNIQPLCQQHFYTGEMIRTENGGRNALIPHGRGTLVWVLYTSNTQSSSLGPSGRVGLPYELLVREFGEVNTLRDAVLLALCIYSGSFNCGKPWGPGSLTVCPEYVKIECPWEDGKPVLKRNQCVLHYSPSSPTQSSGESPSRNSHKGGGGADSTCNAGSLPRGASTRVGKAATTSSTIRRYVGMLSMTVLGGKMLPSPSAGLAWLQHVQFTPHGVGEMYYPWGGRYCGEWESGNQHGFGVEFDLGVLGGTVYIGMFQNNQRSGMGTLYNCETGVVVSGTWNDGKLSNAADVGLPSWPFVLRNAQWKSTDEWSFDRASLVHSDTSLNGTWEPLFTNFDKALTVSSEYEEGRNTNAGKEMQGDLDGSDGELGAAGDEGSDEWERSSVLKLFRSFLQRDELKATLALFQRCFYFLYRPCVGRSRQRSTEAWCVHGEGKHRSGNAEQLEAGCMATSLPLVARLCDLGRGSCAEPLLSEHGQHWCAPSWCHEMGLASDGSSKVGNVAGYGCFHTAGVAEALATRLPPDALFKWAMCDLAFVVSSVGLRLLSCIASHPAAGSVAGSRHALVACWDMVYSLVAPVVHDLACAVELKAHLETSLALGRCASLSHLDFVGPACSPEDHSTEVENNGPLLVASQCGAAFASPVLHYRRRAVQTCSGDLLLFGPCDSNEVGDDNVEAVAYAAPSTLLAAFATLRRCAEHLFPQDELMRERWLSYSIANTFTKAAGVHPRAAMSPPAILRVLVTLATEVNPCYPFAAEDVIGSGGQPDSIISPTRISRGGNEADVTDVMSLLLTIREGVERLRHVYPNVRCAMSQATPSRTPTRCECRVAAVYPLDELAVRTRFVLLGAAVDAVQHTQPWLDCLVRRSTRSSGGGTYGSDKASKCTSIARDDAFSDGTEQVMVRAKRVMQLPVWVMQTRLSKRYAEQRVSVEKGDRKAPSSAPSSEVLWWVMKCIGSVLESGNTYKMSGQSIEKMKASRRRSLDSSIPAPQEACHMDPVCAVGDDEAGGCRNDGETLLEAAGPLSRLYQWKHFIPSTPPHTVSAADVCREPVAVELAATPLVSGTQSDELLTEEEVLNFALIQQLLAGIGVSTRLVMRFCYDNEEDCLLSPQLAHARGGDSGLKPSFSSQNNFLHEKGANASSSVSCVGREATLSLQVGPGFVGSLAWDVLADAWMAALVTLRSDTLNVQRLAKLASVRQPEREDV